MEQNFLEEILAKQLFGKEVRAIRKSRNGLRSMSNSDLLKHYSRLSGKLKFIFNKKRSLAFQEEIQDSLRIYRKEIRIRNLTLPR
jgi:hypothetical protein